MEDDHKRYVCGFLFDSTNEHVLLVQKKGVGKLSHLDGKWNGIGGKCQIHELDTLAMEREFKEETGEALPGWCKLATLDISNRGDVVYFFVNKNDDALERIDDRLNDVGEYMRSFSIHQLRYIKVLENLKWLIPMALDFQIIMPPVVTINV